MSVVMSARGCLAVVRIDVHRSLDRSDRVCNTVDMSRISSVLGYWIAAMVTGLVAGREAQAGPPRDPGGLDGGPYLQLSPGIVAPVIGQRNFSEDFRIAWPCSIAAGRMFTRGRHFKVTIGAALEDRVFFSKDLDIHAVQLLAETRIGAGNRRVWGYGLVGIGPAATALVWKLPDISDAPYVGIDTQLGGGVQGMVGRRAFLGAELDFDIGYHVASYAPHRFAFDNILHATAAFEISVGWYF